MSEKRIEELGFKAADQGFFTEWHKTASLYIQDDPKIERVEAYEKAYKKFSQTVE